MIDSGLYWSKRVMKMHPNAIFLTHAHSDHAGALKNGAPCHIFATSETWKRLQPVAIQSRYLVLPRHAIEICGLTFEVFSVEHSVVGYRIISMGSSIYYVPGAYYRDANEVLETDLG